MTKKSMMKTSNMVLSIFLFRTLGNYIVEFLFKCKHTDEPAETEATAASQKIEIFSEEGAFRNQLFCVFIVWSSAHNLQRWQRLITIS